MEAASAIVLSPAAGEQRGRGVPWRGAGASFPTAAPRIGRRTRPTRRE